MAQAFYKKQPTAADLAKYGFKKSDLPDPEVELWLEHWPVLKFFYGICTQWRQGAAGPTGLDYNVVFSELRRQGFKKKHFQSMLDDLRVIEHEALEVIHKQ